MIGSNAIVFMPVPIIGNMSNDFIIFTISNGLMIYKIILKTYRWTVFAVFFVNVLVFALDNAHGMQPEIIPFSVEFHIVFGVLIAIHFGSLILFRNVGELALKVYFDDHYTVRLTPNHEPVTYKSETYFREIYPQIQNDDDVEIYYNDPTASKWIHKIR